MLAPPVVKDLVLVGGGHSHVSVLKAFAMAPVAGLRVTLVSRSYQSPYSGMLPGVVAGHYQSTHAYIDLMALSASCGVRFINAEVSGLNLTGRAVQFERRPPLPFDVLSLNTGSTPQVASKPIQDDPAVLVAKPIDQFLDKWRRLEAQIEGASEQLKVCVVGGGAAGVELALATQFRFRALALPPKLEIVTAGGDILEMHNAGVRRRLRRILNERGIRLTTDTRVTQRSESGVTTAAGGNIECDAVLWVTQAAAASWLAESGLDSDEHGFITINEYLQSTSHPCVFAVGDVATSVTQPRPKAGVFAVRQGMPLAENLRRAALGEPLKAFKPQRRFLSLISTGNRYAIASRGRWSAEGQWVWRWKDRIDQRFMHRFTPDGAMRPEPDRRLPVSFAALMPKSAVADGMRCGGCGGKLGADALSQALRPLKIERRHDVRSDMMSRDDAAIVAVPQDRLVALSVDAFRPIVDDPFVFGAIAANHCLNDLYAMGAEPQTALAIVALPVWPEAKLVSELHQMLAGAVQMLSAAGAQLVGGHTSEGSEISLGFSVTGLIDGQQVLGKRGLRAGDKLIITKPLGTGCLFAAHMRGQAHGSAIATAIETMRLSNRAASTILRTHGASAVTDVTGFGLVGHLAEMIRDSKLALELFADSLPLLPGALDALASGWYSSLHAANQRAAMPWLSADNAIAGSTEGTRAGAIRPVNSAILFDPQTAGGLVGGVPADRAAACVDELRANGYSLAAVIGSVVSAVDPTTEERDLEIAHIRLC